MDFFHFVNREKEFFLNIIRKNGIQRKKAPEIHVENRGKANTRARAWQAENGKICLVVAGVGGGRSEAVITVPGKENLKSVYGRTIPLGGGRYQYTSDDLGSDILFE